MNDKLYDFFRTLLIGCFVIAAAFILRGGYMPNEMTQLEERVSKLEAQKHEAPKPEAPKHDELEEIPMLEEQKGFLGVTVYTTDDALNIPQGAGVYDVLPGGAADEAGIKVGDIIVAVDDTKIKNSDDLVECIGQCRAGDTISVSLYVLDEQEMKFDFNTVEVTLQEQPQ